MNCFLILTIVIQGSITFCVLLVRQNINMASSIFHSSPKCSSFRSKKVIKLVPEYLLKKRKSYQAIKASQAKLALQEKRKVGQQGMYNLNILITILITEVRHGCVCADIQR